MGYLAVVPGSLRAQSFNRSLASTVLSLPDTRLVLPDGLPLFSQDFERKDEEPDCPPAQEFRSALRGAQAVLLCTPEYDGYPSGVMVNALNWCSRPPEWPLFEKPVGVISASPSARSGRRAQHHIREILSNMGARLFEPMLCVDARSGFDDEGQLTDPEIRDRVLASAEALLAFSAS